MTDANAGVRDYWQRLGILNVKGASDEEIAHFEARYGVTLPPTLREYFSLLNGTEQGQLGMEDEDLISFWHLDQVRTFAEEFPGDESPHADRLFVFADWSINARVWAVHLSTDPAERTAVFAYDPGQQVAASFEEFLQRYVARAADVLFPDHTERRSNE